MPKLRRLQGLSDSSVALVHEGGAYVESAESMECVPSADLCVLIVDDDFSCRLVTQTMVRRLGYQADTVEDGFAAVAAISKRGPYALVLMDYMMPDMDGPMAARAMREHYTASQMPIVALTARQAPQDRSVCKSAGMNDYLHKPIVMSDLRDVIERFCGRRVGEHASPRQA